MSSPRIRLTAAADVRSAALEQLAREFATTSYDSVERLCESADVDAVWVATPNHMHAEHVIAAAERGEHVIVSKPMAVTLDEAARMNAAAERHRVHLEVCLAIDESARTGRDVRLSRQTASRASSE
jgi:phthalate 4,5-cis-dihydrodiol dehydrogenase